MDSCMMKSFSNISVMDGEWSIEGVVRRVISEGMEDEPFYVVDLGEVVKRYQRWRKLMPRVEPFYALKYNSNKTLVRCLAALGAGFDCASRQEIDLITGIGVAPERIIYATSVKMASHMRHAARAGVEITTFDSSGELTRIKSTMPNVKLLLRMQYDAKLSQYFLGINSGCDPITDAPRLLKTASELELEVIGVSFHVESGSEENDAYAHGIRYCSDIFRLGTALGFQMRVVYIGGGFPGIHESSLREVSTVINKALDRYFPEESIQVVAEPGQYFASTAYNLAACVFAKRQVFRNDVKQTMYYLSDGVYGNFMDCVCRDLQPSPQLVTPNNDELEPSTLWGPTCDVTDCVLPSILLPPLPVGSWLLFRNMGAYSRALATGFNGFTKATVHFVVDRRMWSLLKDSKFFNGQFRSLTQQWHCLSNSQQLQTVGI